MLLPKLRWCRSKESNDGVPLPCFPGNDQRSGCFLFFSKIFRFIFPPEPICKFFELTRMTCRWWFSWSLRGETVVHLSKNVQRNFFALDLYFWYAVINLLKLSILTFVYNIFYYRYIYSVFTHIDARQQGGNNRREGKIKEIRKARLSWRGQACRRILVVNYWCSLRHG